MAPGPFPAARYRVHRDVRKAETLPPEAFRDPAFLDRELGTIFRRSWLLAPQRTEAELRADPRSLATLVARRGARAPLALLDRPVFLQRDWKGTLRAFPNVCTHAWHTLVAGPERQRTITCPQHGRQFECDGTFLSQPGFDGSVEGFPRRSDHLEGFPVAEAGELLFVALGKPDLPFDAFFAPVAAALERLPLDRFRRRPVPGEVRELDGNWKLHAWNYLDRMHIPYVHRKPGGLAEAVDLASYRTELYEECALQWAYARDPAHGFAPDLLPDRFRDPEGRGRRVFALWWFLFPNLALNFYPWGLSVNVFSPVPGKPHRTLFLWYHHVLDEEAYATRDHVWILKDTDTEDVDALLQVSRGVASGFAPRGRFAPGEEEGPHWLHHLVSRKALEARPGR